MHLVQRIEHRLTDRVLRRLRPHWLRRRLDRYERFASLRRVGLPEGRRLSVIAPHPDDESIGCGGLIALWTDLGREAEVIFLTSGEMGSPSHRDGSLDEAGRLALSHLLRQTRRQEAREALAILGARAVWLDGRDGALYRDEARLADALAAHWHSSPPDVIAAPYPADRHPDHAVAARITGAASRILPADTPLFGYEVWSPAPATALIDITLAAARKWQAIAAHGSQVATTDYVAGAQALNRYRAISAGQKEGFAEAFNLSTRAAYATLAESLRV